MVAPLINIHRCLPILSSGGEILTPNNRLRNKIRHAYAIAQRDQGLKHWPSPAVFTLTEWLKRHYEELLYTDSNMEPGVLVSQAQRQQLWRQVIAKHDQGTVLINPGRLASDADTAYRTLELWQLDPTNFVAHSELELLDAENQADIFRQWAVHFSELLHAKQLITFEALQRQVNKALEQGQMIARKPIGLYGFDDLPPLTRKTLSLLQPAVEALPLSACEDPVIHRAEYSSLDDEIQTAAHWCLKILQNQHTPQQSSTHPPQKATIGIIVPNLGQTRNLLERYFTEVFEPHYYLPETERFTLPFNFSAGTPLGQTPFIFDTLQLLRLQTRQWDVESLCSLLNSPFWGPEVDTAGITSATAALCSKIRELGRDKISTSKLRQLAHTQHLAEGKQHDTHSTADSNLTVDEDTEIRKNNISVEASTAFIEWLDNRLQQLVSNHRHTANTQHASQWAEYFLKQLELLNWPGQRRLDSNEYQQMQLWLNMLEEFSLLDDLNMPLTHSQAIEQLSQLAITTPYQAQTPDSPIQILGALEGSGLQFSHCWILGMNHKQWPPSPQPNPLLPLELQKRTRMPHVDADKELEYAKQLTENYRHCAKEIIFSSATQDEESPLFVSPLIQDIPLLKTDNIETGRLSGNTIDLKAYTQELIESQHLEWIHNANAPAVDDHEKLLLRGGSSILRHQAICPFAAFAIHRLGATQPLSTCEGLSPIDRGHILHNSLAAFWQDIKDQQKLLSLNEEDETKIIKQHVETAIAPYQRRYPDIMGPRYTQLETQRQCRLIKQWLDQEKQRPAFAVAEIETALTVEFNGLPLTLRLDRLDKLENGQLIVIDYKTGSPNINHWQGDKPEDPQLPLYAICYSADIHALMFVEINARKVQPIGLGDLKLEHTGITPIADAKQDLPKDWTEACEHWNKTLAQLTEDFLNGEALASFKSQQSMRYYTDLQPLTRHAEQAALQQAFTASSGNSITPTTFSNKLS